MTWLTVRGYECRRLGKWLSRIATANKESSEQQLSPKPMMLANQSLGFKTIYVCIKSSLCKLKISYTVQTEFLEKF